MAVRRFCDYNFREYARRRTKQNVWLFERTNCGFHQRFGVQFRAHKGESDPAKISAFYEDGLKNLAVRWEARSLLR